jgi:CyaY protein
MPAHVPPARLDAVEYSQLASTLMAGVEAALDAWLQTDVIDIDSARTGGLLEMSFPGGSKIILNTQPPLQEIWLAAKSGGFHFRHQNGRWVDTKDGSDFYDTLSRCATEQAGRCLRFHAD